MKYRLTGFFAQIKGSFSMRSYEGFINDKGGASTIVSMKDGIYVQDHSPHFMCHFESGHYVEPEDRIVHLQLHNPRNHDVFDIFWNPAERVQEIGLADRTWIEIKL